ncbi:hypothetical protein CFOL_v3_29217 [Cephalotus follicularis]|uniref:Uncharacterized protein n=1 Tax=Cephalotus follicularis TaxID=3775 RepID=A0A1Q3D0G0_CEPFO|nr:hypothetical protein CFOL_v3_29217 [Cephalotus follicularis]
MVHKVLHLDLHFTQQIHLSLLINMPRLVAFSNKDLSTRSTIGVGHAHDGSKPTVLFQQHSLLSTYGTSVLVIPLRLAYNPIANTCIDPVTSPMPTDHIIQRSTSTEVPPEQCDIATPSPSSDVLSRPQRIREPPAYLQDYQCNNEEPLQLCP